MPPTLAAIDSTGATDVTNALNGILASTSNGATLSFPTNGRYRIDGTLVLSGKDRVTIDGHGSTFFAVTNGPNVNNRNRDQWSLLSDTNLVIRDMNVRGSAASTGPDGIYNVNLEAQHGLHIAGSTNVLITNVTIANTWGDLVYVGANQVGSSFIPSSGVTVTQSTLVGASRNGVSVTDADHVTFSSDTIDQARMALVDLEANTPADEIAYVTLYGNTLGAARFTTIDNWGAHGTEHDIVVTSNRTMPNVGFKMGAMGTATGRRYNYTVTNNVGELANQPPNVSDNEPMVSLGYVDNATVSGNIEVFATSMWPTRTGPFGSPQAPIMLYCTTRATVVANNFTKPTGMPDMTNSCSP
jgi:hypothetical protein